MVTSSSSFATIKLRSLTTSSSSSEVSAFSRSAISSMTKFPSLASRSSASYKSATSSKSASSASTFAMSSLNQLASWFSNLLIPQLYLLHLSSATSHCHLASLLLPRSMDPSLSINKKLSYLGQEMHYFPIKEAHAIDWSITSAEANLL